MSNGWLQKVPMTIKIIHVYRNKWQEWIAKSLVQTKRKFRTKLFYYKFFFIGKFKFNPNSKNPLKLQYNQFKHRVFRDALKFQPNPNWYGTDYRVFWVCNSCDPRCMAYLIVEKLYSSYDGLRHYNFSLYNFSLLSLFSLYKYQSPGKPSLSTTIPNGASNKGCSLAFSQSF